MPLHLGRRLVPAPRSATPRYLITFSVGSLNRVQMEWIGSLDGVPLTVDEVRAGFQAWLDSAPTSSGGVPLRTVGVRLNGLPDEVTFRTDWVSDFAVRRIG